MVTLILIALLLPLIGGAALPLFRLRTVKARGVYVEAVVLATSALVWTMIALRDGARYDLFTLMDELTFSFRLDGMSCVFAGLSPCSAAGSLYGFEYMTHESGPHLLRLLHDDLRRDPGHRHGGEPVHALCVLRMPDDDHPAACHPQAGRGLHPRRTQVRGLLHRRRGDGLHRLSVHALLRPHVGLHPRRPARPGAHRRVEPLVRAVFLLAFLGFGAKAAVFPLYAWLPSASVAPTPVTALLHAVAVVNSGAYAVLRVIYYTFGVDLLYGTWAQTAALALSCFTILFGSAMAVKERHFKRRLAYSTVSNLSYMLMGAALMTPAGMVGSLSHLVFHGVIKITLFYCAGAVLVRTGSEYVQDLRGYGRVMPFTCAAFTLGSAALVGTPPLCGFVSKWNLLTAAAETGLTMGTVAIWTLIISAILTAIYLFTIVAPMYFRPLNADQAALTGQNRDPSWMMKLPFAVLCAAMAALGVFSQPLVAFLRGVASGLIL